MSTASAIYVGRVTHHRTRPRAHSLAYRGYWLLVDVDELPRLSQSLCLFSHNRFNLFSLHDRDHGSGESRPLRPQIEQSLRAAGISSSSGKILLLAMPRVLGYAFNPLSVYFCHAPSGALCAIVYEVHNTFGQRHSYVIPASIAERAQVEQRCPKRFYVSPFLDMKMQYDFSVETPGEAVRVSVRGSDDGGLIIAANLHGQRKDLTDLRLLRLFFSHPLMTAKVISAIHLEALQLWLKGMRLRPRPSAPSNAVSFGEFLRRGE